MNILGILVLVVIIAFGIALIAGGATSLQRRRSVLACTMAVIAIVVGAGWLITVIVAVVARTGAFAELGFVIAGGIFLAALVFWIFMLGECAHLEEKNSLDKLTWVIVILFTNIIGAALYFFLRRPQRIREPGA